MRESTADKTEESLKEKDRTLGLWPLSAAGGDPINQETGDQIMCQFEGKCEAVIVCSSVYM